VVLSQVKIVFVNNYKKLVENWITVSIVSKVNSTFRRLRLVTGSEAFRQVLFTSEQPKENKMAFVGIFSQTIFSSVSMKAVDIYLHFGQ